jgi:molybdenum cofactor biosynthesis protein A
LPIFKLSNPLSVTDSNPILYDNHGRPIQYVRLAVTDRCNLRCFYCMPEEGITYLPKKALLTYEEMERTVSILAGLGVSKVRITGGEPFVRNGLIPFMQNLSRIPGITYINLTTNGVLTAPHVNELKDMGVRSVNLSLDTLDRERFRLITRRDELPRVLDTFHQLLDAGIEVKLNAVVMEGKNTEDLIPMTELTRKYPVSVRFIEEMPFNGEGAHYPKLTWNHVRILEMLRAHYPDLYKVQDGAFSTSYNYGIPGHQGTVGIIAAFSRTFCGSCNRIRMTAQGLLKTCLYDEGSLDVRALLRSGASNEEIQQAFRTAFALRAKDGFEAEARRRLNNPVSESMSTIGG